jgi:hypothetical protein
VSRLPIRCYVLLQTIFILYTELASLFINMAPPAQGAAAAALRRGVFAWLEDAPAEFVRLAGGDASIYLGRGASQDLKRVPVERIEGAERLLDLILGLAKSYSTVEGEGYDTSGRVIDGIAAKQNQIRTGPPVPLQVGTGGGSRVPKQATAVRALLWTAVGALWCLCTERVRRAEVGRGVS